MISREDTASPIEDMIAALRLYRVVTPCIEVLERSRPRGRILQIDRHRDFLAIDDVNHDIEFYASDETAIAVLSPDGEPILHRSVIEILAVAAECMSTQKVICIGYVISHGSLGARSFLTVGMTRQMAVFPREIDAVMSMMAELLWRSDWLSGEFPSLGAPEIFEIRNHIPELLRSA